VLACGKTEASVEKPRQDREGGALSMDSGDERMERASFLSRALASEWIPPGLFFIALGGAALWVSRGYPVGDLQRMGPGYFPRMLSLGMICLGVLIVRQGLPDLAGGKGLRGGLHRSFWLIPLALVVFGLSVELLGVVVALALALAVAGFAHREARITEIAISIVTLIVLCVLIFVVALKLPLQLWPEFWR
jgi:hypothetical protein